MGLAASPEEELSFSLRVSLANTSLRRLEADNGRKSHFGKKIALKPPRADFKKVMDSDDGVREWTGNIVSSKKKCLQGMSSHHPSENGGSVSLTDVLLRPKQPNLSSNALHAYGLHITVGWKDVITMIVATCQ